MKEMVMAWVMVLGDDVHTYTADGEFCVVFNDFEGFTDDWDEIHRDYTNPNAVKGFINWLEMNASGEGKRCRRYTFADGFAICTGFASNDI